MTYPRGEGFSFDLFPEMTERVNAAYPLTQGELATGGLSKILQETVQEATTNTLSDEARLWAQKSTFAMAESWNNYDELVKLPKVSPRDHVATNTETFSRLFAVREALLHSKEVTPDGQPIGETMEIVFVPWKAFRDNLGEFDPWLYEMRKKQGIATHDASNDGLRIDELLKNDRLYRNPRKTHYRAEDNDYLNAQQYLNQRMAQDGEWGMILAQTSKEAGVTGWVDRTPGDYTVNGSVRCELESQTVDYMGVFEWLALTLQSTSPHRISPVGGSWLLANQIGNVPVFGLWNEHGSRYAVSEDQSGRFDSDFRPRLAVL